VTTALFPRWRLSGEETAMRTPPSDAGPPVLNGRDVELLRHLAAGRSTSQIAVAMSLSGNTVRTRIHRVTAKLSVAERGDAVRAAEARGLL
jgi:DNA-binding CsgD family transcriptional regulator